MIQPTALVGVGIGFGWRQRESNAAQRRPTALPTISVTQRRSDWSTISTEVTFFGDWTHKLPWLVFASQAG
jgi:hypothetical protein